LTYRAGYTTIEHRLKLILKGNKMKDFLGGIGVIVLAIAALFGISYLSFEAYKFFKPRYTAVDNQVFKESQQYNDGMIRDLESLQVEYINADAGKKDALRAIVLHRFSVYPEDKLPPNLRNFYNNLKAGK
jgi:hypothetical protein